MPNRSDGVHWTKYAGNPILSPVIADPRPWDGYSVDTPDVYHDGTLYHMYYRGWRKRSGTSWIGHATSKDGIVWDRDPANPVLLTASMGGIWDNFQIYRARVFPGGKALQTPTNSSSTGCGSPGGITPSNPRSGSPFESGGPTFPIPSPTAFPNGVNQDQMELTVLSSGDGAGRIGLLHALAEQCSP